MLVTQLPAGAQTWIACGYDNAWTLAEHLMATLIDVGQIANWQRGGDSKAKRPTPVKRPSAARRSAVPDDYHDVQAAAFKERQRRREAQSETTEET